MRILIGTAKVVLFYDSCNYRTKIGGLLHLFGEKKHLETKNKRHNYLNLPQPVYPSHQYYFMITPPPLYRVFFAGLSRVSRRSPAGRPQGDSSAKRIYHPHPRYFPLIILRISYVYLTYILRISYVIDSRKTASQRNSVHLGTHYVSLVKYFL